MKTQSKLFGSFDLADDDNKQFCTDLKTFLGVTEKERSAAITAFPAFKDTATESKKTALLSDLREKTGLTNLQLRAIFRLLDFFVTQMSNVVDSRDLAGDTTKMWSSDLRSLELVSESEETVLLKTLDEFQKDLFPGLHAILKRRTYSAGVLPSLSSFGTTSELRAIRNSRLDWASEPEDYVFEPGEFLAIGSVHISTDSGHPKDFYFQVDEAELKLLISGLRQLHQELVELGKIKSKLK